MDNLEAKLVGTEKQKVAARNRTKSADAISEEQRKIRQLEGRLRRAIRSRDALLEALKRQQNNPQNQLLEMSENVRQTGRQRSRSAHPRNNQKSKAKGFRADFTQRFASAERPQQNFAGRPNVEEREFGEAEFENAEAEDWSALGIRFARNGTTISFHPPKSDPTSAIPIKPTEHLSNRPTGRYSQQKLPEHNIWERPTRNSNSNANSAALLVQARARLLNMEFHIEQRIRQIVDEKRRPRTSVPSIPSQLPFSNPWQFQTQQPTHFEKPEIPTTSNPMASSYVKPNLGKIIENQNPTNLAINPRIMPESVPNTKIEPIRTSFNATAENPMESTVFEPVRPLLVSFGEPKPEEALSKSIVTSVEKQQFEADLPKTEAFGAKTAVETPKEDTSFQRMLEVLKNPRRFDLSSDSEDEEKNQGNQMATVNLPIPAEILKEKETPREEPSTSTFQPKPQQISQLFGPAVRNTEVAGSDSDSDFFK